MLALAVADRPLNVEVGPVAAVLLPVELDAFPCADAVEADPEDEVEDCALFAEFEPEEDALLGGCVVGAEPALGGSPLRMAGLQRPTAPLKALPHRPPCTM